MRQRTGDREIRKSRLLHSIPGNICKGQPEKLSFWFGNSTLETMMYPFGPGQVFEKSTYALFITYSAQWEVQGPLKERLDKHLVPSLFELLGRNYGSCSLHREWRGNWGAKTSIEPIGPQWVDQAQRPLSQGSLTSWSRGRTAFPDQKQRHCGLEPPGWPWTLQEHFTC